jgi:nicotinamide-nucleotide amidase
MLSENIQKRSAEILERCRARGITLATAESCTGGLLAGALTSVAGSSEVFERGFVTYSNAAKHEILNVNTSLIERHGAVSEEVAAAMVRGALARSRAGLAISITGIAGPGGGSAEKPVGLVHFACGGRDGFILKRKEEFGAIGRATIRNLSVAIALDVIEQMVALGA